MQTIAFYVLCFLSREKLWARWSFASGCWKRPQPPPLQLRGQLGFFRLAGKTISQDFTKFCIKGGGEEGWQGGLSCASWQPFRKTLYWALQYPQFCSEMAFAQATVPCFCKLCCTAAVETVANAIASEGKIARKHNSAPVACLCQCRGASRCQTGTPAACTCLTTVSRKGTPPITKIDFFRALQNVICHQN